MYQHKKQAIHLQATSNIQQAIMASRRSPYAYSPSIGTMPQTYRKLSSSWDTKAGSRDHTANIFCNTTKNDAVLHVPSLLLALFNELHKKSDMIKELKAVSSGVMMGDDNQTIWLYTMRPSDAMPKNSEELERLYAFVRMFSEKHLDAESYLYIMKYIHIAVSFFVWFFTKKNFYYYTNEIRQTTRGGIQKQWRSILLVRVPVVNVMQNASAPKGRGEIHQKTILSKLEEEQRKAKACITNLIGTNRVVDFDDAMTLHSKISQYMNSGNSNFIGNKPGKKLQKIYQEYMKNDEKIKKMRKSLVHIETTEKKMGMTIKIPENTPDWGELGAPPPPPKLIRCNADYLGNEFPAQIRDDTLGPNTLEEDVPDSWEDL